jgi:tetratricopeptide (TPR) repeat protein
MTPRTRLATSLAALALSTLAGGCATTPPVSWSQVRPPEVYVETLPPEAIVSVNGSEVGKGSLSFPVPDEAKTYVVRAVAAGFEPFETSAQGSKLAGTRLDLVLRPDGFGSQRRLVAGEPVGLLQAALALLRANRPADALAYAQASLAAGDSAQGHKACGEAYRRMKNREMAIKEYSLYLSLAPDAPDRKEIEQAVAASRKDIEIPMPKPVQD